VRTDAGTDLFLFLLDFALQVLTCVLCISINTHGVKMFFSNVRRVYTSHTGVKRGKTIKECQTVVLQACLYHFINIE
jgi:hypothetical protein